ncbi:MAG: tetratricopeptide repeat protein, partial [Planctomycetota bacterium]|nr:tetratricopeptide repeat protein [Planctomycetota bacterium]
GCEVGGALEQGDEAFTFAKSLVIDRQDYEMAAQKFLQFVKEFPQHPAAAEALWYAGLCFGQLEKHEEAAAAYTRLLKEYPQAEEKLRQEAMRYAGDALFRLQRYEEAAASYDALLQAFPRSPLCEEARLWRGEACARLGYRGKQAGDQEKARQWLERAIADFEAFLKTYPESKKLPQALAGLGFAYFDAENYPKAAEVFSRVAREFGPKASAADSRAEECQLYLAECFYRQKQYEAARLEYARVLEQFPKGRFSVEARSGMAWCDYAIGKAMSAKAESQKKILEAAEGFAAAAAMAADKERELSCRFQAGCAFREAEDFGRAVEELRKVAEADGHPQQAAAWCKCGVYAVEQARLEAEKAQRAGPETDAGRAAEANRQRLLREAVTLLRRALAAGKLTPAEAAEAGTFLGEACLDLKDYAAAAEAFASVAEKYPQDERAPWALYHLALALGEQPGKLAEAKNALQKLVMNYAKSRLYLQAAYLMADYQARLQDLEKSRKAYLMVAEQGVAWAEKWRDAAGNPDPALIEKAKELAADSLFRLGESWYKENPDEAAKYYQAVCDRYPGSRWGAMALVHLGLLAENRKDMAAAQRYYASALEKDSRGEAGKRALFRLGYLLVILGQSEKDAAKRRELMEGGRKYLTRFLAEHQRDPLAPKARYYRGLALEDFGDKKSALADYKSAYEADPKGEIADAALYQLGWCQRDGGEKQAARKSFQTLVETFKSSPQRPDALYALAIAKREAKEFDAALADIETLLREYSQSPTAGLATLEKARILSDMGKPEEAIRALEAFLKENPKHEETPRALYSLAWAWWALAEPKFEEAKKAEKALRDAAGGEDFAALPEPRKQALAPLRKAWEEKLQAAQADEDRMAAALQRLVTEYPDFNRLDAAWLHLGEIAYTRRQYSDALAKYEKAREVAEARKSSDVADKALYRVGWCHLRLAEGLEQQAAQKGAAERDRLLAAAAEKRRAALAAFEKLATAYPQTELGAEGYFRAAELRREAKDYDGAITEYRRALERAGKAAFAPACSYGLGLCLLEKGQAKEALEIFRSGELSWVYSHLVSLSNMNRLVDRLADSKRAA